IAGHSREFIFGKYKNIPLIIASRVHYYETGDAKNILKFFNILKDFGIKTIIATTAVGAVNEKFKAGDLMLIKDHINLTGTNPLIAREPVMFLDMSNAYDKDLRSKIKKIAKNRSVSIHEGVHIQVSGPSYETPAEVRAFRKFGADTVSMSTAMDCISANYFGIKFVAFAGITNSAITNDSEILLHDDVVKTAGIISKNLSLIIKDLLSYLNDVNKK
ncbi:MAG: purine-nucleoside phosphorylase, partial [Clostridia bacterium]|nr:purine-nucleoside phosphorylase [Clostridia bacterium]